MGSDPWLKAITSTVGHLAVSFLCRRAKRPPSRPDGRSIGAMRPDQAVKIGAQGPQVLAPRFRDAALVEFHGPYLSMPFGCHLFVSCQAVGSHLLNRSRRRSNNCLV
jgi:hypothetical protein